MTLSFNSQAGLYIEPYGGYNIKSDVTVDPNISYGYSGPIYGGKLGFVWENFGFGGFYEQSSILLVQITPKYFLTADKGVQDFSVAASGANLFYIFNRLRIGFNYFHKLDWTGTSGTTTNTIYSGSGYSGVLTWNLFTKLALNFDYRLLVLDKYSSPTNGSGSFENKFSITEMVAYISIPFGIDVK